MSRRKRLTRLSVAEISAVDHGASGDDRVRPAIVLMKRDAPPVAFVSKADKTRFTIDSDRECATLLAEHAAELGLEVELPSQTQDMEDDMDTAKAVETRLSEIVKKSGISPEAALLQLAESRDADDRALWAAYKDGSAVSLGDAIDVGKALNEMDRRISQLLAAGAARSRESAIAKVASSTDPTDQQLWRDYRIGAQVGVGIAKSAPPKTAFEMLQREREAHIAKAFGAI